MIPETIVLAIPGSTYVVSLKHLTSTYHKAASSID